MQDSDSLLTPTASTISTSTNSTLSIEENWDEEVMTLEQGTPGSLEKDLHSLSLSSSNLANTATSEVSGDDSTDSIQQGPPSLSTSTSTSSNNTAASDSTDEKEVFDLEKRLELKRKEMEILKKIEEQKDREGGWKLTEGEKGELLKKEIGDWINSDPLPYEQPH